MESESCYQMQGTRKSKLSCFPSIHRLAGVLLIGLVLTVFESIILPPPCFNGDKLKAKRRLRIPPHDIYGSHHLG